jgi:hypothetical protein
MMVEIPTIPINYGNMEMKKMKMMKILIVVNNTKRKGILILFFIMKFKKQSRESPKEMNLLKTVKKKMKMKIQKR